MTIFELWNNENHDKLIFLESWLLKINVWILSVRNFFKNYLNVFWIFFFQKRNYKKNHDLFLTNHQIKVQSPQNTTWNPTSFFTVKMTSIHHSYIFFCTINNTSFYYVYQITIYDCTERSTSNCFTQVIII